MFIVSLSWLRKAWQFIVERSHFSAKAGEARARAAATRATRRNIVKFLSMRGSRPMDVRCRMSEVRRAEFPRPTSDIRPPEKANPGRSRGLPITFLRRELTLRVLSALAALLITLAAVLTALAGLLGLLARFLLSALLAAALLAAL